MLLYLLLFYLFRNTPSRAVDASPILNLAFNTTSAFPVSFISIATRQSDSSMTGTCNCNQRSTLDIIWSCVATLFLCTWSSIHPNVPAPKDEWWLILWRRLKSMYWALVAPELVLTWAVRQWISARDILREYEKLPGQPKWTKKHAHFLQMGGFHLRKPEEDEVLPPWKFLDLLEEKQISVQSIEERDIEDKSKADSLTKIVVIFQTLWFVIQCIGRHAQGLALAQLEVATLAVISCTFILCVIWWDKPFDVQQPIYLSCSDSAMPGETVPDRNYTSQEDIDMENLNITHIPVSSPVTTPPTISDDPEVHKDDGTENPDDPALSHTLLNPDGQFKPMPAANSFPGRNDIRETDIPARDMKKLRTHSHLKDNITSLSLVSPMDEAESPPGVEKSAKKQTVLQTVLTPIKSFYITISSIYKAILVEVIRTWSSPPMFLPSSWPNIVEICLGWTVINPIASLMQGEDMTKERVGIYFSSTSLTTKFLFFPVLSAALFGLVHCISWESEFPSAIERALWRVSAVGVGSILTLIGLGIYFDADPVLRPVILIVTFSAYILARYYLVIEALLSLRALPPSAFQTIEWSDFLPHV